MTREAMVNAIIGLALMGGVAAAYGLVAHRYRYLWHPVAILVAVITVSVVVSVTGETLWGSGWTGVPTMLRRSAIGGFGWGLIIASAVWIVRRGYRTLAARRGYP
jgi:hypothetical protein